MRRFTSLFGVLFCSFTFSFSFYLICDVWWRGFRRYNYWFMRLFVRRTNKNEINGPVWRELAELWREALRHCGSTT